MRLIVVRCEHIGFVVEQPGCYATAFVRVVREFDFPTTVVKASRIPVHVERCHAKWLQPCKHDVVERSDAGCAADERAACADGDMRALLQDRNRERHDSRERCAGGFRECVHVCAGTNACLDFARAQCIRSSRRRCAGNQCSGGAIIHRESGLNAMTIAHDDVHAVRRDPYELEVGHRRTSFAGYSLSRRRWLFQQFGRRVPQETHV